MTKQLEIGSNVKHCGRVGVVDKLVNRKDIHGYQVVMVYARMPLTSLGLRGLCGKWMAPADEVIVY